MGAWGDVWIQNVVRHRPSHANGLVLMRFSIPKTLHTYPNPPPPNKKKQTNPAHDTTAGLARLDSRHPPTRPFFTALFRHVQMVGARGLYRTAWEVGKFLLSLDPT